MPPDDLPVMEFGSAQAWESWLDSHHASAPGIWMKIAKKGAGPGTVSYPEALEVAICFGWIDGQKARLDERYWLQRFTPRRRGARWSKINADKAEELIRAGRMRPAGLREVEAARADGRWQNAYQGQRSARVPADFAAALAASPAASEFFATLRGANRYAILYRIGSAKRPETRAARIEKFIAMLAAHETIYP
jgi:uncharacterized protein YdeI (YjbR/CyaY-like superfamily)